MCCAGSRDARSGTATSSARVSPFFHKLVADLAAEMGEAYPELRRDRQRATDVLKQEEERFFQTISNGMEILEAELAKLGAGPNGQPAGGDARAR